MLKKLRIRFTLICVLTTGLILMCLSAWNLYVTEIQVEKQSGITFQNNINSIIYKLQVSKTIDNSWLSQIEAGNGLIIHIEDNKTPLMFKGSWQPTTDRNILISKAQTKALESYNFNIKSPPDSIIEIKSVTFEITGDENEKYQAAAVIIPSDNGWQSLTLLRDLRQEEYNKLLNRIKFISAIIVVIIILSAFSWWFAGIAIEPIVNSSRQQMEFVAAASHELRAPLAVVNTSASAIPVCENKNDEKKFLDVINRECLRMSRLVDDLLILASADAQTWSFQKEKVEIETAVMNTYETYEQMAKKKNQKLLLELPDYPLPEIQGDRQRMEQALASLLDNAIYYTQDKGIIKIGAYHIKGNIVIYISDNGPGIPDEMKKRIFERFYRIDSSRSKNEHYGLGLSVAKEIINKHNGKIYVNDTKGGGSTFFIELPV